MYFKFFNSSNGIGVLLFITIYQCIRSKHSVHKFNVTVRMKVKSTYNVSIFSLKSDKEFCN